jgi:hypothetical protein
MEFDDCLKRVWLDLLYKHRQFAKDKDELNRQKIFELLDELEAVYPQLSDWNV